MFWTRKVSPTGNRRHRTHNIYNIIYPILLAIFTQSGCQALDPDSASGWLNSIVTGASDLSCSALGKNCCEDTRTFRQDAIPGLSRTLRKKFFGQHIAYATVISALDAHLHKEDPEKALVLSFHGGTGTGKSYLTRTIIDSLFSKGMDSKNVKWIHTPSIWRTGAANVKELKDRIQREIMTILTQCPHSIIVFDQLANTPLEQEVLQAIMPFIGYPTHKNAIFIFISSTGSDVITEITSQVYPSGRKREDLTYHDFESHLISSSLSNQQEQIGIYKRSLIDQIDYFVPFLPMEKEHVRQCVDLEATRHPGIRIDPEKIIDGLEFPTWFSTTGCKRIEAAVKYEHEESLHTRGGNSAGDQNQRGGAGRQEFRPEEQEAADETTSEGGGSWVKTAAIAAATGTVAVVGAPVVLTAAGFGGAGVVAGSLAATVQSVFYGGNAIGLFAACQSAGAAGIGVGASAVIGAVGSAIGATTYSAFSYFFNSTSTN